MYTGIMGTIFEIVVGDKEHFYRADLIEIASVSSAFDSLSLGGKHYAIRAEGLAAEQFLKMLDILNTLYPGKVKVANFKSLPGRVDKQDVELCSLHRKISEVAAKRIPASRTTHPWVVADRKNLNKLMRDFAKKYLAKYTDPTSLKLLLIGTAEKSSMKDFEERFDAYFKSSSKDADTFLPFLEHVSEGELFDIFRSQGIDFSTVEIQPVNQTVFTSQALEELKSYMNDPSVRFSGVVSLQDATKEEPVVIGSDGIDPSAAFSIHSVGKVFTGMLLLRLIHQKKLNETILKVPLYELGPKVSKILDMLPLKIKKHIREQKITLHTLLLHKSGLGDYKGKYSEKMARALLEGKEPSHIDNLEAVLQFADDAIYPLENNRGNTELGPHHYSNLGWFFVGLIIQQLTGTSFDELLKTYVVQPAHMNSFSHEMSKNALVNPNDPLAGHVQGTPDGGDWMCAEDLGKFGAWCAKQYKDPEFRRLLEMYGTEFYSKGNGEIHHAGGGETASSYLSVFPVQGIVISILSNQSDPGADKLYDVIRNHILYK